MSADLAAFLLARCADEEAAARQANGRVAWLTLREADGSMRYTTVAHQLPGLDHWVADGHEVEAQGVFVFYDSARVLAECEAKRATVRLYQEVSGLTSLRRPGTVMPHENARVAAVQLPALEGVLQLLALPYSSHPDYDPAWRP